MSVRHEIPLENEQFAQTGGEYKSLSVGIKVNVGKWRSVKEGGKKVHFKHRERNKQHGL